MRSYNHLSELTHHGILGMKWGVHKDRRSEHFKTSKEETIISKKGEPVELHLNPMSATGMFLRKLIPSIAKRQDNYTDYTIRPKGKAKAVGTVSLHKESNSSVNVVWIDVNDKSKGRGYGQSAMRTIIDDIKKDANIKQMTLEVPGNSPNARHIYEKLGFKVTGEKMLGTDDDVWGGLTKMQLDLY